ncbi:hypothetical protein OG984_00775 [Nocardioides sp. NBC_00368]|uniref:hypothetical protein n=1 Tax=Nocardioides sp. NBC_00368 TaxID=2976000 RepID=UPI002E20D67F
MTSYEGFRHALTSIEGTQWRLFERLANVFLADEFPSLRPMAAPGGDEGMDACLFRPVDDDDVVLQFSLRKDWDRKVKETCRRLKGTAPDVSVLIYATNQAIGAAANELKKVIRRDYRIFLDIRDQEWFLTSRNRSAAVQAEAEQFMQPFDVGGSGTRTALERQAQALDDLEAKAAFVYLGLQWQDDTRDKGLTKVCFEAVVRAVLRETDPEHRMTRHDVKSHVAKLLPGQHTATRDQAVDAALRRLSKVYIRHHQKIDEFCLTWEERKRLAERLADVETLDGTLDREVRAMVVRFAEEDGAELTDEGIQEAVARSRSVLERVLLDRGELFAEAVIKERQDVIARFEDVEAVVYTDFAVNPSKTLVEPRVVAAVVISLMIDPPEDVRGYLRSLADTYTLFAFMRETPDVQSAIVKIFSEGDIWLDASVVLPLFAEDLLDSASRTHGLMLRAVWEAGLRLYVTPGVVEEVATHIARSRGYYAALSRGDAYGPEPFLLSVFKLSGRSTQDFESWLETFCGRARQFDDIADYLEEEFNIHVQSLQEFVDRAAEDLVAQVGEIWHEARDRKDDRREKAGLPRMDAGTRALLVGHDVENYVGVQMRREARGERRSAFGFKSWWLTLDGTAFRVAAELADRLERRPPPSPAISPDFMLHYLGVGPARARLSRKTEETLPLMLNMRILDVVPKDLLDLSDALRKELVDLPPRVIRRKIRDTLDEARLLMGERAQAGEEGLTEDVKRRLIAEARNR